LTLGFAFVIGIALLLDFVPTNPLFGRFAEKCGIGLGFVVGSLLWWERPRHDRNIIATLEDRNFHWGGDEKTFPTFSVAYTESTMQARLGTFIVPLDVDG
jgi:hypothetical protein